MRKKCIFLCLLAVMVTGCDIANKPDPAMIPNHVIELEGAKTVDARLRMRAGEMRIGSDALALMVANYKYNTPIRLPKVNYRIEDEVGYLDLTQELVPSVSSFARGDALNRWDVQFNKKVPLEMEVQFGRGTGDFNLNGLDLKRLKILNEAGDIHIDLSSAILKDDLTMWINNQKGNLNITFPKDIGVEITTVRGATIQANGFEKEKAIYSNSLKGKTKTHIFVDVKSDAGNIIIQ